MEKLKKLVPRYFFLLLVILTTVLFFGLVKQFALAIFWATTLALLFHKRFDRIKATIPEKPGLAAGLTVGLVLLIAIVPIGFVGLAVFNQAGTFSEGIKTKDKKDTLEDRIENKVEDIHDKIDIDKATLKQFGFSKKKTKKKVDKFLKDTTEKIGELAIEYSQSLLQFLVSFFLMLYILFFFLRDGRMLIRQLIWVIPMKDKQEMELLKRFESVCRATVKGSLVVAFVQGAMGGVLFWALGIKAAFLWGILMILASLLPVGSAIVWVPWAIILIMRGDYGKASIMIAVGVGLIGLIDNFLRPRLVGQDTKMPDYLILLSTLGGLTWFGISGFVIGPVIAALFITCWQMMGEEYGKPYNEVMARKKHH